MSNPYAPKKKVVAKVAEKPAEENENLEVPEGSISDIVDWVGDNKERAKLALEAEKAGKKRQSLMKTLKGI